MSILNELYDAKSKKCKIRSEVIVLEHLPSHWENENVLVIENKKGLTLLETLRRERFEADMNIIRNEYGIEISEIYVIDGEYYEFSGLYCCFITFFFWELTKVVFDGDVIKNEKEGLDFIERF